MARNLRDIGHSLKGVRHGNEHPILGYSQRSNSSTKRIRYSSDNEVIPMEERFVEKFRMEKREDLPFFLIFFTKNN